MTDSTAVSGRKIARIFVLSVLAASAGTLLAHLFGSTLQTSPVWLGPALVIAALTVLIGAFLLLPIFVRALRANRHGPAA